MPQRRNLSVAQPLDPPFKGALPACVGDAEISTLRHYQMLTCVFYVGDDAAFRKLAEETGDLMGLVAAAQQ